MPHMYWSVARPLTVCPFENLKFTNNISKGFGSRIISKSIYVIELDYISKYDVTSKVVIKIDERRLGHKVF